MSPMDAGRKLALPVLMIRGKQDIALLGGMFKGVDRYLADSQLVEVDKCSHWVQHDASEEVNAELDKFLAQLEAPDTTEPHSQPQP